MVKRGRHLEDGRLALPDSKARRADLFEPVPRIAPRARRWVPAPAGLVRVGSLPASWAARSLGPRRGPSPAQSTKTTLLGGRAAGAWRRDGAAESRMPARDAASLRGDVLDRGNETGSGSGAGGSGQPRQSAVTTHVSPWGLQPFAPCSDSAQTPFGTPFTTMRDRPCRAPLRRRPTRREGRPDRGQALCGSRVESPDLDACAILVGVPDQGPLPGALRERERMLDAEALGDQGAVLAEGVGAPGAVGESVGVDHDGSHDRETRAVCEALRKPDQAAGDPFLSRNGEARHVPSDPSEQGAVAREVQDLVGHQAREPQCPVLGIDRDEPHSL